MKKIRILALLVLTLAGCNVNKTKGYEFSYIALDSLLNEVSYDESIEIKNVLYHPYEDDSDLNELVVMYYTYEHEEYGLLDEYLKFEYDEEDSKYLLTLGSDAEMFFYFATGMDNENYTSLKAKKLNKYLDKSTCAILNC